MVEVVIKAVVVLIIGYLLGSINTSIIVGKCYGIDIREHGSGNAGMTNTLRTLGKVPGILVILGDVLKGVFAAWLGYYILGEINGVQKAGMMVGGIGAIFGHNFPIYFNFKGGKGILTSAAILATIDLKILAILACVFLVVVILTRYISLGSIIGVSLLPLVVWILRDGYERIYFFIFALLLAVSAIVMHRGNIQRLINGTESKFSIKKE